MGKTLEEILASNNNLEGTEKLEVDVGKVITVVDFEYAKGPHGAFVIIEALDEAGDDIRRRTGAQAVMQQLPEMKEADLLPCKVKVDTYPTTKGNPGITFALAE